MCVTVFFDLIHVLKQLLTRHPLDVVATIRQTATNRRLTAEHREQLDTALEYLSGSGGHSAAARELERNRGIAPRIVAAMSNLYPFVVEMKNMLSNLDRWLEAAGEFAKSKNVDPDTLVVARLAIDQYPLVKQVQAAADSAKFTAARLTGKDAPAHADEEKTFEEVRARVGTVTTYLATFSEKDFDGAEARKVALPFLPGGKKGALGLDYLVYFAQPNFFFHIAHAYAILRHNGVKLGKMDYIGSGMPLLDM